MEACEKYLEQISSFVDDELSEAEQIALFIHLEHCPACQAELAAYQEMSKALQAIAVDPPAGFSDKVVAAIGPRFVRKGRTRAMAMAAMFVVVAIVGGVLAQRTAEPRHDGGEIAAQPAEQSVQAPRMFLEVEEHAEVKEPAEAEAPEAEPEISLFTAEIEDSMTLLDINTTLWDTFLAEARHWRWAELSQAFAEFGYEYRMVSPYRFEVKDPYNPGGVLYGYLGMAEETPQELIVLFMGYQFVQEDH